MFVTLVRLFLIAMAVILAPVYGLWIFGGWMMDRRSQRASAMMKGRCRNAA